MKKRWKMLLWVLTILCCAAFAVYCFYSGAVADHNAPKITISEETIAMSVYDEQDTLLKNATAWDEEDGNVTGSMVIESVSDIFDDNMATVTYAAFDQAGNVAKAQCTVVYQDYEGPRFSLTAPLMFRVNSYFNVFNVIEAQDGIDGDLTSKIKGTLVSGQSAIQDVGEYQVLFRVTNSLGHTVYLEAPVEIVEENSNVTRLELKEYLVYKKQNTTFDASSYLLSADSRIKIESDVNMSEAGVYTVTYRLNSDVTRLIVVVEE